MLKAAVYLRISARSEESTSIEGQEEAARAYCLARGWPVVAVFTDEGISGGKDRSERPGLAHLLQDAAQGRFEVVVIGKLDRLARSLLIWNDTRAELDGLGVALASVAEGLDLTTPAGRMVANVLASFAEFERERIGERIREAQDRMGRDGRYYHGPVAFGYQAAPREEGGLRLALHPEEAPRLRQAIEGILEGRISSGEAVRVHEERGEPFPSHTGLRRLLRNPLLLGHHLHRGEPLTGDDGLPVVVHDAIVTPSEFARLDEVMRENQNGTPRASSGELRLLNALGVLECSECSRPLTIQRKPDWTSYGCARGHVAISADRTEEAVEAFVLERFGAFEVTEPVTTGDPEAAEKLLTAQKRRDDIVEMVAEGLMPPETARGHLERLKTTITHLEALVAQGGGLEHEGTGESFRDAWAASDIEGRRALLAAMPLSVAVERSGPERKAPQDRLAFFFEGVALTGET